MQKLQNRVLRKISFKKFHHPIKHIYVYNNDKILKFADILKFQNCFFMSYQFEQNNTLATSFVFLPDTAKTNTITIPDLQPKTCKMDLQQELISMTKNLLSINVSSESGEQLLFSKRSKFPQITENKLSYMNIKRILKQAIFDQY